MVKIGLIWLIFCYNAIVSSELRFADVIWTSYCVSIKYNALQFCCKQWNSSVQINVFIIWFKVNLILFFILCVIKTIGEILGLRCGWSEFFRPINALCKTESSVYTCVVKANRARGGRTWCEANFYDNSRSLTNWIYSNFHHFVTILPASTKWQTSVHVWGC
jgi:hypothetical protein